MWKLSQFTVVRNLSDRDLASHHLIYHTGSHQSMTVTAENWNRILSHLEGGEDAPPEIERALGQLAAAGIIVRSDRDERSAWEAEFDSKRYRPRKIFPILTVTTACNIGCTYCYEEGIASATMTPEVIAGCMRWIKRRAVEDGIEEIHPGLFGGEPLLYPRLLFEITDRFADLCRRHRVRGSFYCSSNGMLLTEELGRELARRGLRQMQISLDGPPEIHDQRRLGKRGQPSFQKSLSGLRAAVKTIPSVTVKVNFDRHNRRFAARIFDLLVEEALAERVSVKLEAVAPQMAGSTARHPPAYVIPPESEELAEAYTELALECMRRGIRVSRDTAHTTPCMFTSEHGVIIGPDGGIYKCVSLVGRSETRVGSVFDEDYDTREYTSQMDVLKRLDACFDERCPYVPVCAGGCAYHALLETGTYQRRFCTREYLHRFYDLRYLTRHREQLEALGMRAITPEELALSGEAPPSDRRAGGAGAAGLAG